MKYTSNFATLYHSDRKESTGLETITLYIWVDTVSNETMKINIAVMTSGVKVKGMG